MNIHSKKFKIVLIAVFIGIALLAASIPSIVNFFHEKSFISKYSDKKDFWPVYETIKENKDFIKKNPGNDSAYYSLGQGYYGLKAYDEAIGALIKTVEIKPDNADYWSFLGKVYQAKKDYPKARDAYIKTLKLNPEMPISYAQLAWLYYFRLDPEKDKAFEILRAGLEKFPTDKDILFDITRFYLYDKNEEEFRKYAPRYLKIDPQNEPIKNAYEKSIQ